MPGPRQPTDVVKANGKKHLSKAEEAERRRTEVKAPKAKTAKPPKWLPEALRADFRKIGKQLIACGIYTDLDADNLGRYLVAQQHYLQATAMLTRYLNSQDVEGADEWGRVQERHFKQARNCANDLGLTVIARCRLVVPEAADGQSGEDVNPFLTVIQGGAAKRA